jgi:peptidoglycan hydrolase CwlO-like protein
MTSLVVGALVGNEILSSSVRTSTHSVYHGIIDILGSNADSKFKHLIEEQDVYSKIKVIHEFIDTIPEKNQIKYKIAIDNIEESLTLIEREIETIKIEIQDHEEKYFSSLRVCYYKKNVDNLVKYVKILDGRFDLLIKIMK